MASIPSKRVDNNNCLKICYNHCFHVNHGNINSMIIGVSILADFARYNEWENRFRNGFINLGISGDCVDHVL